jgi:hypothetical protein
MEPAAPEGLQAHLRVATEVLPTRITDQTDLVEEAEPEVVLQEAMEIMQ